MRHRAAAVALLLLAAPAFAEVSDKMPTLLEIFVQGVLLAIVVVVLSLVRWWFGILGVCLGLLMLFGTVELHQFDPVGASLVIEQGQRYFLVMYSMDILVVVSGVFSAFAVRRWHSRRQRASA